MPYDDYDRPDKTELRREALARTIHLTSVPELTKIGDELFPSADHPWRDSFFSFLKDNAAATFYHASTDDHVQIVYCKEKNIGIWFVPGGGSGPLQEKGRTIMKDIVESARH